MKKQDFYKLAIIALPIDFTIWGSNIFGFLKSNITLQIVLMSITAIIIFVILKWIDKEEVHSFDENEPKFFKFFANWYNKNGRLYIFCDDLEWLDNDNGQEVINSITKKGDRANIFLRNVNGVLVQKLRSNQVNVFHVSHSVASQYRFSLIVNDGIKRIIIRNKEFENQEISFMETNGSKDPYLLDFAFDLLEYCKI